MAENKPKTKDDKPLSTTSQKLTALAAIYSAAKLNSLVKSNQQIVAAQEQSNVVLKNIDGELLKLNRLTVSLESLQNSTLSELQKKNERDRLRDEITDYRYQIEELRREQERLEATELQYCKDSVHTINRESKLLLESDYTKLEKLFLLDTMIESLSIFTANKFKEIADKQYLADTEDFIKQARGELRSTLSKQEATDYEYCTEVKHRSLTLELDSTQKQIKTLQKKIKAIQSLEKILEGKDSLSDKQFSNAMKELVVIED